jgi:hypothetical protein
MIARLAVALLCACCAGTALAQRVVTFALGTAEVVLPSAFVATEQNDGTLRAVFGPGGTYRLELAVKDAVARAGGVNVGEAFVREEAKRKDLKLFEMPGKVVYLEPVADRKEGDKVWRTSHWHIGFGNSVAVMTLTAPVEESPELQRFLGKPLNDAIASVRRRRA